MIGDMWRTVREAKPTVGSAAWSKQQREKNYWRRKKQSTGRRDDATAAMDLGVSFMESWAETFTPRDQRQNERPHRSRVRRRRDSPPSGGPTSGGGAYWQRPDTDTGSAAGPTESPHRTPKGLRMPHLFAEWWQTRHGRLDPDASAGSSGWQSRQPEPEPEPEGPASDDSAGPWAEARRRMEERAAQRKRTASGAERPPEASEQKARGGEPRGDAWQQDPHIAQELARGRLRQRPPSSNAQGQSADSLRAMAEGAGRGEPLMCVAAARAGRDDIVRIALENFNLPYDPAAGMLCAQMLQAALSARPAAVEVARMLVETGAVDPMEPLPLRDVSVNVSVGGRTTSRILGDGVSVLHLAIAAQAANPQPARQERAVEGFSRWLLGLRGVRPNVPTAKGEMPLLIAAWNGDVGVKAAKLLLEHGAVATTDILLAAEGWSMRRQLLRAGAELPARRRGQGIWHDDDQRPDWMESHYQPKE